MESAGSSFCARHPAPAFAAARGDLRSLPNGAQLCGECLAKAR
ncbi:hypothetical protein CE91St46_34620 [Eubacteriales bacterium]|nr:hypothetical protein CE91St46_34620 [Eubacteriales bacterium]GKH65071.1 hypothetical protein CE91St47_35400 [Eubacteriales bacterium]